MKILRARNISMKISICTLETAADFLFKLGMKQPLKPQMHLLEIIIFSLQLKFVYSEKATKFCKISTLLVSTVHTDKSKVEI